jgi:hypothetical protein
MAVALPVPAIVSAKLQWSPHHFHQHDHRPRLGDHLQLLAPSQRAHPWPVHIKAMSGQNNTDVVLEFPFAPSNPLPPGTTFELVWVNKGHHHVIAMGETT